MSNPSTLLIDLPEVPSEKRPRSLFVNYSVPKDMRSQIEGLGWKIVDIRLLSVVDSIDGTLEGIRVGSIIPEDPQGLRQFLELEAKICGKLGKNEPPKSDAEKDKDQSVMDLLSSFGTSEKVRTEGAFKPKKKRTPAKSVAAKKLKEKLKNG